MRQYAASGKYFCPNLHGCCFYHRGRCPPTYYGKREKRATMSCRLSVKLIKVLAVVILAAVLATPLSARHHKRHRFDWSHVTAIAVYKHYDGCMPRSARRAEFTLTDQAI